MLQFRTCIAALLCVFFTAGSYAQDVNYSTYEKFDLKAGDFSVVGMTGGRIFTYRAASDNYYLDAYNDSMVKTATIVLDFFPVKIYQTKFIAYPDHIIVLYQAIEGNKVIQYAALLDENGRLRNRPVLLDNVKTGFFGPTRNYFSSAVSEDKKTILVYSANEKGSTLTFDGKWINEQLAVVHRSHVVYNADNEIVQGDAMAGNDGGLYLPVYTPAGSRGYYGQAALLTLNQAATKFSVTDMPLNGLYTGSIYMKLDNAKNRIYAGGFYADKKNSSYEGVLYAYYDVASAAFVNIKTLPFDGELLGQTGARNARRAFDNFQVRQLIVKNDGGFVLVAEAYFVAMRSSIAPGLGYYSSYYGPYMNSTVREYHYNDIMALSYSSDGTKEWGSFIPKEQYSQEDGGIFSSYALLNTGGALAFLFNDFNSLHSQVQLATLDAQGKVDIHSFSAPGVDNPDWLPRSGKQVAGRIIVVPCLHRRQICFAKVVF